MLLLHQHRAPLSVTGQRSPVFPTSHAGSEVGWKRLPQAVIGYFWLLLASSCSLDARLDCSSAPLTLRGWAEIDDGDCSGFGLAAVLVTSVVFLDGDEPPCSDATADVSLPCTSASL